MIQACGVASEVTIKPVKIFGNDLSFVTTPQLVNAIAAGSGSGIAVMNNSWGHQNRHVEL